MRKLSVHRWNEQKWANSPKIYSLNSSGCACLQSSVNNHSTHSSVEQCIIFSFNSVWGSTIISDTHNTWILMDYLTEAWLYKTCQLWLFFFFAVVLLVWEISWRSRYIYLAFVKLYDLGFFPFWLYLYWVLITSVSSKVNVM